MIKARGRIAVAGILLAGLVLTGCVSVVEPPLPGVSDAEAERVTERGLDDAWSYSGISDQLRPNVERSGYTPLEDFGALFVLCMNDAGYPQYFGGEVGGYSMTDHVIDQDETIANYICTAKYQVDPREYMLNREQLEYLYDYYQRTLIPCLARAGLTDLEYIPTREEALQTGPWNPYYSLPDDTYATLTSESQLVRMCPPIPPGVDMKVYLPGSY